MTGYVPILIRQPIEQIPHKYLLIRFERLKREPIQYPTDTFVGTLSDFVDFVEGAGFDGGVNVLEVLAAALGDQQVAQRLRVYKWGYLDGAFADFGVLVNEVGGQGFDDGLAVMSDVVSKLLREHIQKRTTFLALSRKPYLFKLRKRIG
jgi:hypothetical protein